MGFIQTKRIYEPAEAHDGERILVDRIWPRGISKHDAKLDLWFREIAPTAELRKWFGHDPARFEEFRHRYREELTANTQAVEQLRHLADCKDITLLYAARDKHFNHAIVLATFLQRT